MSASALRVSESRAVAKGFHFCLANFWYLAGIQKRECATMPRKHLLCAALIFTFFSPLCASPASAQSETATISGQVVDSLGAIVSNAEAQLKSVERGTTTTTATNNSGIYVFVSVKPGEYQLTVRVAGFKQVDFLGLVVNVQDHIEQNFHLQVGSVSESVTVEGNLPVINTQDATVSTLIDREFVENLPINGRSFQTLISLTPGVVLTPSTFSDPGQFSVNGQRASSNYFTVDGVSANIGVGPFGGLSQTAGGSIPGFNAVGGTKSLV